jgi:hypothetical protein
VDIKKTGVSMTITHRNPHEFNSYYTADQVGEVYNNEASTQSLLSKVASLKMCSSDDQTNLVYDSVTQIEARGGFCLTQNLNQPGSKRYDAKSPNFVGIVLLKEKITQGNTQVERWFLHLCPGNNAKDNSVLYPECKAIFPCFSEEEYDKLMPIAINKLEELKIVPDFVSNEYGTAYEFGTRVNFTNWQNKQPSK